jgi:hypothetical protein
MGRGERDENDPQEDARDPDRVEGVSVTIFITSHPEHQVSYEVQAGAYDLDWRECAELDICHDDPTRRERLTLGGLRAVLTEEMVSEFSALLEADYRRRSEADD